MATQENPDESAPIKLFRRPSKPSETPVRTSLETRQRAQQFRRSTSRNQSSVTKKGVDKQDIAPPSVDTGTVSSAVAIQFNNNTPLDALNTQPIAQLVQPPIMDINRILNDTAVFPERDPLLIEIQAPPPYPVDLIDPHQRHVSITAADHHDRKTLILMGQTKTGTSARPSGGIKEINLHKFFVKQPSVLTEAAMRWTVKRNSQERDRTLSVKENITDQMPDGTDEQLPNVEQAAVLAELETDESRKLKDVLADVLKPTYKKWSKLCQEEFPDGIMWKPDGNLAALVIAYFESCSLKGTKLNLKSFFVRNLPPVWWLRRSLMSLNISFNSFEEMPETVFHLRKLVVLKARNNPIKTIGYAIQRLESLRYLSLSFCMLDIFPESVFGLPSLEILDVSYNVLSSIPREIMKLRCLRVLNISGNIIGELPACLVRLPKLASIIAADSYVTLTTGRKSPTTTRTLCPLHELAADTVASLLSNSGLVSRDLKSGALDPRVLDIMHSAHTCEWCSGSRFGHGHELVKAESIGKLRFASFVVKYQVCERCCTNPYRVFSPKDLERHINAGLREAERMERNDREKREGESTVRKIKKSLKNKRNKSGPPSKH